MNSFVNKPPIGDSHIILDTDSDRLQTYLDDISKTELLTPEQEQELSISIQQGDEDAVEQLVKANLLFVVSVAKQYQHQGLGISDLINEGNYGLMKAAKRFDASKKNKFITYAVRWIRAYIYMAIGEQNGLIRLPIEKRELNGKFDKAYDKRIKENHTEPTHEDLARMLGISEEAIEAIIGRKALRNHVQTDAPINKEEGDDTKGSLIENFHSIDPLASIESKDVTKAVTLALDSLKGESSKRIKEILIMKFGINRTAAMTSQEIADLFGVSRQNIDAFIKKGLQMLRTPMNKLGYTKVNTEKKETASLSIDGEKKKQRTIIVKKKIREEVADTILHENDIVEIVDDNRALLTLYEQMSKPIQQLKLKEVLSMIKTLQTLAAWDKDTVAEEIETLKNFNGLNLHQISYLVSIITTLHTYQLNEAEIIHLSSTIADTHKLSTDINNAKITPLLSLLLIAPEKSIAFWEQKAHNESAITTQQLTGLHEGISTEIDRYQYFLANSNYTVFIDRLENSGRSKGGFLLTQQECKAFTDWLAGEKWYAEEQLREVKATIKAIGGSLSSAYKSLEQIVDKINTRSELDVTEINTIMNKYNDIIVSELDQKNYKLLTQAGNSFMEIKEKVRVVKEGVIGLLKYILGEIESVESLDTSKINIPTLVENIDQPKNLYGTKSIGELILSTEILQQTLHGQHPAFVKIDAIMTHEKQFFKKLAEYISAPVSGYTKDIIAYVTTVLGSIYAFDTEEGEDFITALCCTRAIDKDEIAELTQFVSELRKLEAEDFRSLLTNMNQIYSLVKNKAQRVNKLDHTDTLDPLTTTIEALLHMSNKNIRESHAIIKKLLYPEDFTHTIREICAYRERKNELLEIIKSLEGMLGKTNTDIYMKTINNIASLPDNQDIGEIAGEEILMKSNVKLKKEQAILFGEAIREYYYLYKNIEAITLLSQDDITHILQITYADENNDNAILIEKITAKLPHITEFFTQQSLHFLAEMLSTIKELYDMYTGEEVAIFNPDTAEPAYVSTNMGTNIVTNKLHMSATSLAQALSQRLYTIVEQKRRRKYDNPKRVKGDIENYLIKTRLDQDEWLMQISMYLFVDKAKDKDPWITNLFYEYPAFRKEADEIAIKIQLLVLEKCGVRINTVDMNLLF